MQRNSILQSDSVSERAWLESFRDSEKPPLIWRTWAWTSGLVKKEEPISAVARRSSVRDIQSSYKSQKVLSCVSILSGSYSLDYSTSLNCYKMWWIHPCISCMQHSGLRCQWEVFRLFALCITSQELVSCCIVGNCTTEPPSVHAVPNIRAAVKLSNSHIKQLLSFFPSRRGETWRNRTRTLDNIRYHLIQ